MTDTEFARKIYCFVLNINDNGDANISGIIEIINTLNSREQEVLNLYYRQNQSYKESAMILGVSSQTVRNILLKVKLKLRHQSRLKYISLKKKIVHKIH